MKAAAANLEFEKAASLRDRHQAAAQPRARPAVAGDGGADVRAGADRTGSKTAVLEVQEYVRLLVGRCCRGLVTPPDSTSATSSSSSTRSASAR